MPRCELDDGDYGRTAESLKMTLRASKMRSRVEDVPLPPPRAPVRCWLPRYWLCRLYLATSLLATFCAIRQLPDSVLARILNASHAGWPIVYATCFLCVLAVLDVLVNDLAPAGYSLRLLRDHRHMLFNAIALGILGLGFAIVKTVGWSPVLLCFADDLALALAIAPLDMYARHREQTT